MTRAGTRRGVEAGVRGMSEAMLRPWEVVEFGLAGYGDNGPNFFIVQKGKDRRESLAVMSLTHRLLDDGQTPEYLEAKANAALIVRAVNSHDDLIETLDPDALDAIANEIDCFEHSARAHGLRGIAKRQRAALAKASS